MVSKDEYKVKRQTRFKKIEVSSVGTYGLDLIFYSAPKDDSKGIYILVVIDFYSRLMGAMIQHDKEASTTLANFKAIIKKYFKKKSPHTVYCDSGGEFKSSFSSYLDKKGIYIHICEGDGLRDSSIHLGYGKTWLQDQC
jgi:hypothetical protein